MNCPLNLLIAVATALLSASAVAFESNGESSPIGSISGSDDIAFQVDQEFVASPVADGDGLQDAAFSPEKLKELMRPNFRFATEWQAPTNEIGITICTQIAYSIKTQNMEPSDESSSTREIES